MSKVYKQARYEIESTVNRMMALHHPEILDSDLTFQFLECSDSRHAKLPALTHQGYLAAAVIRITPVKDRVAGVADVTITFDTATWDDSSLAQRDAICDHELEHVSLQLDKHGQQKTDTAGRPVLKLRKHDLVVGGFSRVVERHKEYSVEAQAIETCVILAKQRQMVFAWEQDSPSVSVSTSPAPAAEKKQKTARRRSTVLSA